LISWVALHAPIFTFIIWLCNIKNIRSISIMCGEKEDLVLGNTVTSVHEEKNENCGKNVAKRWMKKNASL
jgi:hypothetical protein